MKNSKKVALIVAIAAFGISSTGLAKSRKHRNKNEAAPVVQPATTPANAPASPAPAPAPAPAAQQTPNQQSDATNAAASPQQSQNAKGGFEFIKRPGVMGAGLSAGTLSWFASFKYFFAPDAAIEIVGPFYSFVFWGGVSLGLTADYLYEGKTLVDVDVFQISWQIGGGAGFGVYLGDLPVMGNVSVHFNIGLQFALKSLPLEWSLSYRPGLAFGNYPDLGLYGVRLATFDSHKENTSSSGYGYGYVYTPVYGYTNVWKMTGTFYDFQASLKWYF